MSVPVAINALRGEFTALVAGELCRFDTRLATIAAIEAACGDRAIVEILNGVILGRRARDQIPLIAAALSASEPWRTEATAMAADATGGGSGSLRAGADLRARLLGGARRRTGGPIGPFGREAGWRRWREFALGCLTWSEETFWACSWLGFVDAWNGHHRFVLGLDPDDRPVSRAEAERLEAGLRHWQHSGTWGQDG